MAWIESHQTLAAHPKTRKLAMLLGVSKPAAIGHLHCFWWWALDYASDGSLNSYDYLDIAIGAEWDGDAQSFFDAMVAVGFIDITDDGDRIIHDWYDYAGKLIERRKANAQRMKEARAAQSEGTNSERAAHVRRTHDARVELPNRTQPNPTKPDRTEPTTSAKPTAADDERFVEFWKAYPNKVSKQAAAKAFAKVNWKKVEFTHVMAALENHKQSVQWTKDDGQFVPHAATWLNKERWEDELRPAVSEPGQEQSVASRLAEQARREREEYEQARSNRSNGGTGDSVAGKEDYRRNESGLFLVPGRRTG